MSSKSLRTLASVLLVGVLAAACGGNEDVADADSGARSSTGSAAAELTGKAAVDSAASTTRSVLTAQLQEHVYLAGLATGTALTQGPDSAAYKAAGGALDANSVALSQTVASVYGDAGGKQFLDLWRKHIGFFVEYTLGAAKNDTAMKNAAVAKLDGYRADFGAFLESATEGQVTKDAIAKALIPHIQSLAAAVDAQAKKDPKAFDLLKTAAGHMPGTAQVLAGAIAEQKELAG